MPQSLARVMLHIVFSTKDRFPWLKDATMRKELQAYMAGVLETLECHAILINGVEDHVHILCQLSRTLSIAMLLEEVKKQPSKWIKTKGASYRAFHWQNGYGAFSVSESNVPQVRRYIADQERHHRRMTYQDEFRLICRKHQVPIDERYVWD